MVNIIKSEDLTLDEIKSRIISLDSRFAQGEFRFVKHQDQVTLYQFQNL